MPKMPQQHFALLTDTDTGTIADADAMDAIAAMMLNRVPADQVLMPPMLSECAIETFVDKVPRD